LFTVNKNSVLESTGADLHHKNKSKHRDSFVVEGWGIGDLATQNHCMESEISSEIESEDDGSGLERSDADAEGPGEAEEVDKGEMHPAGGDNLPHPTQALSLDLKHSIYL
jgi:hypothetical protein